MSNIWTHVSGWSARRKYDRLMKEFEYRCYRAAMMNYEVAADYDNKVKYLEIASGAFGTISVGSGLVSFARFHNIQKFSRELRLFGLFSMGTMAIMQLIGQGSTEIIPSFLSRADSHKEAAAGWQRLAHQTKSYRIQLYNPRLDVAQYAQWYECIAFDREKICKIANVPQAVYNAHSDEERVFEYMKKRKLMHQKLSELEDKPMDLDGTDKESPEKK